MSNQKKHHIEVVYTVKGELAPSKSRIHTDQFTLQAAMVELNKLLAPHHKKVDRITFVTEVQP